MTGLQRTVFLARRPQEGERGSAEQPRSARICSVVDPGRVHAWHVQERHSNRRCQGAKERDGQNASSPKTRRPDTEPEGENRRPDQVELLFDGATTDVVAAKDVRRPRSKTPGRRSDTSWSRTRKRLLRRRAAPLPRRAGRPRRRSG